MIPLWYTACRMAATGVAGYLCSQLWPIATKKRVARERRRLERKRRRTVPVVAEPRRLSAWVPPAVRWEAVLEDNWPLPVSPRLTDWDRIEAAKRAVIDVGVAVVAVCHAAAPADIDWYRNEHPAWTWGRLIEMLARLASVGKTFVWRPEHGAGCAGAFVGGEDRDRAMTLDQIFSKSHLTGSRSCPGHLWRGSHIGPWPAKVPAEQFGRCADGSPSLRSGGSGGGQPLGGAA